MQLWNNNKNNGETSNPKEQYDSFIQDEEFKKALNNIRLKYSDFLKKLLDKD